MAKVHLYVCLLGKVMIASVYGCFVSGLCMCRLPVVESLWRHTVVSWNWQCIRTNDRCGSMSIVPVYLAVRKLPAYQSTKYSWYWQPIVAAHAPTCNTLQHYEGNGTCINEYNWYSYVLSKLICGKAVQLEVRVQCGEGMYTKYPKCFFRSTSDRK